MESITYREAVARVSRLMDARIIDDAFQGSSILAGLFAMTKEDTLESLIVERSKPRRIV